MFLKLYKVFQQKFIVLKTTILNTFNPHSVIWYDVVHKAGWLAVLVDSKWPIIYSAMPLGI